MSDYAVGKFESLPSRKSVKKAIKRSLLLVNKKPSHTGYWVKEGDVLIVVQDNSKRLVYERELKIIFEDDHIAAVIKPGDVPVSGNSFRTLQNALSFNLKPSMQKDSLEVPRPVHRLDRQTSGVLLIAKTRSSAAYLGEQFEKRRVHKTYLACISGKLDSRKTYSSPIEDKEALTEIKPFQKVVHPKFGEITSIEANPKTGRRNQIRIHLSEEGFPILGDLKFGGMKSGRGLFLFAQKIAFNHPETNELISLEAEVPKKFLKVMGGRS
ncbi:MAG: RluA family pseudouridine synthase [Bacteroidota bacterium]